MSIVYSNEIQGLQQMQILGGLRDIKTRVTRIEDGLESGEFETPASSTEGKLVIH